MNVQVSPSSLNGTLQVPGSKSHTIRSVLLATLAEGTTTIDNPLDSGDGLSALNAAKAFGAKVRKEEGRWTIEGRAGRLLVPDQVIDTGNSGTTTCFFASVAALVDGYTVLTGDEQIRRRPIKPLVEALSALGASSFLTRSGQNAPPVVVQGVLRGGEITISGFNSQYVSSLLLSCPLASGDTILHVDHPLEKPYLQMTLDWMRRFSVAVKHDEKLETFWIQGRQQYKAGSFVVPSDWSAVAFPLVGAAITHSDLVLTGLDWHDSQGDKKVVDILIEMGAHIAKDEENGKLGIQGGASLHAIGEIDLGDIPDSLPALSVAATQASGTTIFTNLAHVRVKETDRVLQMQQKLNALGCDVQCDEDCMMVKGPTPIQGGILSSSHDHRIAMALVAAGMASKRGIVVTEAECADVSFPHFFSSLVRCNASLKMEE